MIYHYTQFLSIKDYCAKHKMKMRTVHTHLRELKIGHERVDGIRLLLDKGLLKEHMDAGGKNPAPLNKLRLARNFAIDHKYAPRTIYEAVITGKINAYVAGNFVFINTEDPTVGDFLKNHRPQKSKYS
jgi:hypothetical protein